MTTGQRVIKHIRRIPPKPLELTDPMDIRIAEAAKIATLDSIHEHQLRVKRNQNLLKARRKNEQT